MSYSHRSGQVVWVRLDADVDRAIQSALQDANGQGPRGAKGWNSSSACEQRLRWSRFPGQNGGLAKVDSGFDYAANFSSRACVA